MKTYRVINVVDSGCNAGPHEECLVESGLTQEQAEEVKAECDRQNAGTSVWAKIEQDYVWEAE